MIIIQEARHLETLKCYYNEPLDVFVFHCAGKKITIQYASPEQIASIFRKAQVKDDPHDGDHLRSVREKTYLEMVAAIIDGSDQTNYLWSSDVDIFFNACEELRQSRIGKIPYKETAQIPSYGWKGKWDFYAHNGHLSNIKKAIDQAIKTKGNKASEFLHGNRGLDFYFGETNALRIAHYFLDLDINIAMTEIGGAIKYKGRVIDDEGDLRKLADTLNKRKFMPSNEFIQWINSDD